MSRIVATGMVITLVIARIAAGSWAQGLVSMPPASLNLAR
jgi:hypothetical protein